MMNKWLKRGLVVVGSCLAMAIGYHWYYADSPLYEMTLSESDVQQVGQHKPTLVVDKGDRRIYLVQNGLLQQDDQGAYISWPIALGKDPIGTKLKDGDQKTPEGLYTFTDHAGSSAYYGSLWINYPNALDAKRGVESGLLSDEQYKEIVTAEQKGLRPLDRTKMGGEILIHGTYKKIPWTPIPLPSDTIAYHIRTQGCVGMSNQDIFELRELLESTSGTVLILP